MRPTVVLLLAACLVSGRESEATEPAPEAPPPEPVAITAPVPPPSALARTEDEDNTIAVFRAVAPATVFVTQTQVIVDRWRMQALEVPAGSGTGFLWDASGHVVTNWHVVDGGRSYKVTLYDGSEWPASLVGGDPRKDVAVLKIEAPAERLVAVRLPDAGEAVEVGQKTLAIGNPFGLDHTLTTGVVSALGREVMGFGRVPIRGMIQTDASINPGNSGGPLLDSRGRVIGMNTMIYSESGQSAGIGFAVPIDTVRRVAEQVITTGHVERVGLGVTLVDDQIARRAGIDGVAILEVGVGGPAEKAGLKGLKQTSRGIELGDVIVGVDGAVVHKYEDLYFAFDDRKAGDVVTVTVLRDGKRVDVQAALIAMK